MANYYAEARSNYFKVEDPEKFREFCRRWGLKPITRLHDDYGELHGFTCEDLEGGLPHGYLYEIIEEMVEEDPACATRYNENPPELDEELAQCLAPGWIAVLIEVGHEKLRVLAGHARAIDCDGNCTYLNLSHIYEQAQKELGGIVLPAEY